MTTASLRGMLTKGAPGATHPEGALHLVALGHLERTEAQVDVIKVLIAEDNAAYRQSLYRMLREEEGIEVLEPAGDGREAVEKSALLQPDVVLMDVDMPEGGGLWATRAIREQCPHMKVIILSLHSGEAFRTWAQQVGATAFLSKDVDPETIIRAIRAAGDVTAHLFPG